MKATINSNLLQKLQPKTKPYDVRDNKLLGFLVRVNISGKLLYMCEYGRGKRVTIGRPDILSVAQARDKAKMILADAAAGNDPRKPKADEGITISQFIDKHYKPWVMIHRKSGDKTLNRIKSCFCVEPFKSLAITQINPLVFDEWRTKRIQEGRSRETVNRDIATFKAAISKAVEWGFMENHPLRNLKLLKVDTNPKVRYLSATEEQGLRQALEQREQNIYEKRVKNNLIRASRGYPLRPELSKNGFADYLKPMILVAINTGIRQGELFSLTWGEVDLTKASITIAGSKAKSGKTRHIPLNSEALNVIKTWQAQSDQNLDLVFPSKQGKLINTVKKVWANILAKAEITSFRWHDLRHHFASRLVMAGVDLNTVRELLGHSDIKMTLRYAHLAPEHKANAVEKLIINKNLYIKNIA